VSIDAATAAGFAAGALDRRVINVRGRIEPLEVVSVRAPTEVSGSSPDSTPKTTSNGRRAQARI